MTDPNRRLPMHELLAVAQPAAGSNFTFTNDKGQLMLVRAVIFTIVTSAAVANRFAGLKVTAAEKTMLQVGSMVAQTATLTRTYSAYTGTQSTADSPAGIVFPWRDSGVLIEQGYTLASNIAALDVADQVSGVFLDILRFNPEYLAGRRPYVGDYAITDGVL